MKNRKEELLEKISGLFAKKGYEKSSMRDIAAHLAMTKAGLYYYFENKQQMLVDIINYGMDQALSEMRQELPQIRNTEEKVEWIIRRQIDFYSQHQSRTKVSIHERDALEAKHARIISKKEKEYVKIVKQVIKQIIDENRANISPQVATFSLLGMLNWLVHWYDPRGKVPPDRLASNILSLFLAGIKNQCPAEP
jgi:AcrR family transcriptional regulator